ncbi:DUF3775 domain-containing protein [Pseudoxanthobacter sp.]|uniref:DUF3775 domain-containing protein n=1 Tax=Pseudoxanthobacter sp. TaxID=1925742 RepID=UPI002FE1BD60
MADQPNLTIAPEDVWFVISRTRQFEARDAVAAGDSGSEADGEGSHGQLADLRSDPVRAELISFIRGLNEDEQIDLVALAWLGRGDADIDGWDDLRSEAERAHNNRTASYLLGIPLLPDYLEDAMEQCGYPVEELETDRL